MGAPPAVVPLATSAPAGPQPPHLRRGSCPPAIGAGGGSLPGLTRRLARPLAAAAFGEPCDPGRLSVGEVLGPNVPSFLPPLFLLGRARPLHLEFCDEGCPKGDPHRALATRRGQAAGRRPCLAGLTLVQQDVHNGAILAGVVGGAWRLCCPGPGARYGSPGAAVALVLPTHVVPEAGWRLEGLFLANRAVPARLRRASAVLAQDVCSQVAPVPDHLAACGALCGPTVVLPVAQLGP